MCVVCDIQTNDLHFQEKLCSYVHVCWPEYVLTNLPPFACVRVWRGVACRWSEEERRQFLIFVTAQSALPSDHLKARNGHIRVLLQSDGRVVWLILSLDFLIFESTFVCTLGEKNSNLFRSSPPRNPAPGGASSWRVSGHFACQPHLLQPVRGV